MDSAALGRLLAQIPEHPVYYRILCNKDFEIAVVTMQDFDEYNYDQRRFVTKEKFPTELAAHEWIVKQHVYLIAAIAASKALGYLVFQQVEEIKEAEDLPG